MVSLASHAWPMTERRYGGIKLTKTTQPLRPKPLNVYDRRETLRDARDEALGVLSVGEPYVVIARVRVRGNAPGQWVEYFAVLSPYAWEQAGRYSALMQEVERWKEADVHALADTLTQREPPSATTENADTEHARKHGKRLGRKHGSRK